MKKSFVLSSKSVVALTLAGAMVVTGFNSPVSNSSSKNELIKESEKTVFNEIKKSNFSETELNEIAENALVDGENTATEINEISDKTDFIAAVNYAMTAYYENENFDEMADFEATIDSRSAEIIQGYKDAADERAAGSVNGYEVGTVLLEFDKSTTKEEIEAVVEAEYGECRSIYEFIDGDFLVTVDISLGKTVAMAEETYANYSIVEVAEANGLSEAVAISDYVNDTSVNNQYYLNNMNVKAAWDYVAANGFNKVIVGVVDSGVDIYHSDLNQIMSPNSAEIWEDGTYTLHTSASKIYDNTHGTNIAGVIAAEANNGYGVAGIASCYNNNVVEILSAKVTQYYEEYSDYRYPYSRSAVAMDYCIRNGAKVINYSAGSYSSSTILTNAITRAVNAGAVVVASAGNDTTADVHFPSDLDNVLSIIATDSNDKIAYFSNFGPEKDFAAPGYSLYTTSTAGLGYYSGTSFSAPAVAAVVAMMYSQSSKMNFDVVYDILGRTARPVEALKDKSQYGVVDAYEAVKAAREYDNTGEYPTYREEETTPRQYDIVYSVAVKKPVTTSTGYDEVNFPGTNLVDGDATTKWISGGTSGQWLQIDLQEVVKLQYVEVNIERYINAACQILISEDGTNWTTLEQTTNTTLYSFAKYANKERVRYVKLNFTGNTTYLTLSEIRVGAFYINPAEETTAAPATTTIVETTTATQQTKSPIEVFGQVVSSPSDGMINVVWGQNIDQINLGQKYNVYVDDKIAIDTNGNILSMVDCNSYNIYATPGSHTVRISAKVNGIETTGVTTTVNVSGTVMTTAEPTTVAETTAYPYENVAKNKAIMVSSLYSTTQNPASYAVDGNMNTSWKSSTSGNQWINVDLGKNYLVDRVHIRYGSYFETGYKAMYSVDGTNWTLIGSTTYGTIETDYTNLGMFKARYVKFEYPSATSSINVCELEVYGEAAADETTTVAPTTVAPTTTAASKTYVNAGADWNNMNFWSVYVGAWAGNPTVMYADGNSYSDFGVKINNASTAAWGIQMKTQAMPVEAGQQYVCKVTVDSNIASASNIRIKDDKSGTEKLQTLVAGKNTFELKFTASSEAQIFFDLGLAPAGLEFVITSFSLTKEGEQEVTTVPETTTVPVTTEAPTTTTEAPTTTTEAPTTEQPTTVAKTYVNAGADWNNLNFWSVYVGVWAGNPTVMYADGNSYSDFGVKINNASTAAWGIQMKTQTMPVEAGQQYVCKVLVDSNIASTTNIRIKDDKSGTEKLQTLVAGENTFELTFTAASEAQIFFDLGLAPAGLEFVIKSFSLAKVGEETTTAAQPVVSEVNVATGKTAYSSSVENDSYGAAYATDGNANTRWSSAWTDNEWMYVDLGASYDLTKVNITWEGAYASEYKVQVSNDASNWQDVATVTNGAVGLAEIRFDTVNARYVRILGVKRGTGYGYSIYELEVFALKEE